MVRRVGEYDLLLFRGESGDALDAILDGGEDEGEERIVIVGHAAL